MGGIDQKLINVNAMTETDLKKHAEWLQQVDIQSDLSSDSIRQQWFSPYRIIKNEDEETTWHGVLVPVSLIPSLLASGDSWDTHIGDGLPSMWTISQGGKITKRVYCPFGNEEGLQPLVISRSFHSLRPRFLELSQEFCQYHNLYPDLRNKRFLAFDVDGNESDAARYGEDFFEVRSDLLLRFCAIKQMALAMYVDSFRYSDRKLDELGLSDSRIPYSGPHFTYHLAVMPYDLGFKKNRQSFTRVLGKNYILPGPIPSEEEEKQTEVYQEFIIDSDTTGKPIRHTCDPSKLADFFGKNPGSPYYLTPVFFKAEVLAKYYADPQKYSVGDGNLRCAGLWDLRLDNDQADHVVVWLGDLGRDLSGSERNYWLSFNIPPQGRSISRTTYRRAVLGEWADPERPDLLFKQEYECFQRESEEKNGLHFLLSLHRDDAHFLTALRLPAESNQAEFDAQLIALTKIMVDSLNEKEIAKGLTTLDKNDKGIAKLEKFFVERGITGYESHIKFLRVLQDLRSKSAAHRKGSSYDQLIEKLHLADEGRHWVFGKLLLAGTELLNFLRQHMQTSNLK